MPGIHHIHYDLKGESQRPVILFLHGFLGNGADWGHISDLLSPFFRCLLVDLPGHGRTLGIGREMYYDMPHTARSLISLLNALQIEKCNLVGYSMGGRLGLYLLCHFPQHFNHAILESTFPGLKTAGERRSRREQDEQFVQKLMKQDLKEFLREWYEQPLFRSIREHPLFDELFQHRLCNNPWELAKSLRGMGTGRHPSLWQKLSLIKNPLLLLVGEYDVKFKAIAREMVRCCPSARLEVLEGCGHNIHFEKPEKFVEQIVQFFTDIELRHKNETQD